MRDCYQRLLEKEGRKALWRGYSVEIARIFAQKSVETKLNRSGIFALRRWMSLTPPPAFSASAAAAGTGTGASSTTGWLLATAVEGTLIGTAAMAVVYPLSVLHAKMATDVVRKIRKVRKVVTIQSVPAQEEMTSEKAVLDERATTPTVTSIDSSIESISRDSVEWVEHTHEDEDERRGQELNVSTPLVEVQLSISEYKNVTDDSFEFEESDLAAPIATPTPTVMTAVTYEYDYELSYKYKTFRQVFNETLASSEGYLGFYKGFSTVVASAFVSRLGLMTIYTLRSFFAGSEGSVVFSPFQMFLTQTALSVITYPLNTIGNRRMIAAPGRYSSSWEAAQHIVKKQGWQALFKGVELVVVRSVVLAALSQLLL